MGAKAGLQGHIQDRRVGLAQEFAGALQSQTHVIGARRHAEMAQEETLDLADGEADRAGELHGGQRIFEVIGHEFHDLAQLFRLAVQIPFAANALAVGGGADSLVLKLVGNFRGERGAKIGPDDFQHQVDGRGAARAGIALAINFKNIAGALDVGIFFAESGTVFPMDRAAVAGHEACIGQHLTAQNEAAQRPSPSANGAKGRKNSRLVWHVGRKRTADKQDIGLGHVRDRMVNIDAHVIGCRDRCPCGRHCLPGVEILAAQAVGRTDDINCCGQRKHAEPVGQQEREKAALGICSGHAPFVI